MPELRWTLLILGALFIGGLALWEWRRQRHARGSDSAAFTGAGAREGERISPTFDGVAEERSSFLEGAAGMRADERFAPASDSAMARDGGAGRREGERISPTFEEARHVSFADGAPGRGVFREPTLSFPEVSVEMPVDTRERFADPPVVELDEESLDRLKDQAGEAVDEFSEPHEDGEAVDDFSDVVEAPSPAQPMVPKLSPATLAPTLSPADGLAADGVAESGGVQSAPPDPHDEPTPQFEVGSEELGPASESAGEATPASAADSAAAFNVDALEPVEPIVEWPEEDTRKIVALRLVSSHGERFAGRAVRLALAAEGFVLGKFDIFHKPGPDARAVLSAASLTKPGTFSLATMDAQRFGGLSLFAVLPGPLSPLATFDELLTTARALNDRLRGALQDERGEPLTPVRSANIRESLTASAAAAAPVVGAAAPPPVVGSPSDTSPA
jgi:cell division protein ZipA